MLVSWKLLAEVERSHGGQVPAVVWRGLEEIVKGHGDRGDFGTRSVSESSSKRWVTVERGEEKDVTLEVAIGQDGRVRVQSVRLRWVRF